MIRKPFKEPTEYQIATNAIIEHEGRWWFAAKYPEAAGSRPNSWVGAWLSVDEFGTPCVAGFPETEVERARKAEEVHERRRSVLQAVCDGGKQSEIAKRLGVKVHLVHGDVDFWREKVFERNKLNPVRLCHLRLLLVEMLVTERLVETPPNWLKEIYEA